MPDNSAHGIDACSRARMFLLIIFHKKNQAFRKRPDFKMGMNVLSPANNPQQNSYDGYNQQYMYDTTGLVAKIPDSPGNNQDNCDQIQ